MKYLSTRGDKTPRGFCDILLEGLAPDGGLYLPVSYPVVDAATLQRWRGLRYAELAFEILSLYIDDIPAADLRRLCEETYTEATFGSPQIRRHPTANASAKSCSKAWPLMVACTCR